ncbi:K02A2.6-like [Cordylochernes scorpioides]|uniref:K02A2.6-like n=1 Tax=Cordylochernes scorpioides TaxID=51811 RepID=A0ABY6L6K8_9ARAC|nr:K02A2.6-like [Cordylochernes scorpioides]
MVPVALADSILDLSAAQRSNWKSLRFQPLASLQDAPENAHVPTLYYHGTMTYHKADHYSGYDYPVQNLGIRRSHKLHLAEMIRSAKMDVPPHSTAYLEENKMAPLHGYYWVEADNFKAKLQALPTDAEVPFKVKDLINHVLQGKSKNGLCEVENFKFPKVELGNSGMLFIDFNLYDAYPPSSLNEDRQLHDPDHVKSGAKKGCVQALGMPLNSSGPRATPRPSKVHECQTTRQIYTSEECRKRFERYLVVSGMKKKEEADKIDLFMYLMGDRADDIFRTFKFEKEEEATKIDSFLKAFDSHFCVRKNIIYERAKFNSRIQEDREPVDEFITSLYKLADSCEFEGLHEQLIRDRIVVGVRDKALSERMQLDSELTLEKAVKMVRQQEAVRQQQVDLQRPSTSQKVNQVKFNSKKQSPKQQQQPAKTRSRCPKCGGFTHREGQACRAEGQKCNLCSKTGHFANCCPDKQAKTAEVKAVSDLDEEIGFLLEVSAEALTAEIQVNGKKVKFKLDSQADVTSVPLCLFKKIMGQQRLVESDINIRAAEISELQTVGMFLSTLRNGNYEIKEKIYVIRRLSEPLLSRRACELLNLARRIEVVATRINPIKEFPEVFEGLGQIGNPYEIKLKPGAKPYAVHTPRRVPIPLMEKLKTRLEELEKAGIIAQVNVATEWCAPTVIAGKPNGDIRLCVDLSRLNEDVQREVHPMPVVEHMLGQLGEARFFSKLDANSGFHQIPLSPDCQHLTTFITPFGRYKYCRMPFGISLAPEYFQKVMSIILQGMDGVMCYLDDILIFASDSKTHDRILRLVLRKLKEAKVTLNKAKCVFGVPRINFLGHILDEDGIRPDPAKIDAVAKMPAPTDVHGVRRFLGMVNHLGRKLRTTLPIAPENLNPRLVDSQTLKRKEGRRRKDMKSRYDRRCGATDMEELSEDSEGVLLLDFLNKSQTITGNYYAILVKQLREAIKEKRRGKNLHVAFTRNSIEKLNADQRSSLVVSFDKQVVKDEDFLSSLFHLLLPIGYKFNPALVLVYLSGRHFKNKMTNGLRTPLHIFSGVTLTAQRYRDEILEPYLRPYRDQIGHHLILMGDNARPHRARLVNEHLQRENIRRMDLPARSPDLNPIEHVWDALGRRIGARHPSPRTLVELRTALLEEWGLLPLDLLQSLKDLQVSDSLFGHLLHLLQALANGKLVVVVEFEAIPNMEADAFAADSNMSTDAAPPYPWSGTLAEVYQVGQLKSGFFKRFTPLLTMLLLVRDCLFFRVILLVSQLAFISEGRSPIRHLGTHPIAVSSAKGTWIID